MSYSNYTITKKISTESIEKNIIKTAYQPRRPQYDEILSHIDVLTSSLQNLKSQINDKKVSFDSFSTINLVNKIKEMHNYLKLDTKIISSQGFTKSTDSRLERLKNALNDMNFINNNMISVSKQLVQYNTKIEEGKILPFNATLKQKIDNGDNLPISDNNKQPVSNKEISNNNTNILKNFFGAKGIENKNKSNEDVSKVSKEKEKENDKKIENLELETEGLDLDKLDLIPSDLIQILKKLGEGGFGEVFSGKYNIHSNVAIKKIKADIDEESKKKIIKEVELMNKVKHPKLIDFYGYYIDENQSLCFVMELCQGGDLSNALSNENYKLTMKQKFDILRSVGEGIHHFHTQKPSIVHRDIKTSNVLISDKINNYNSKFKAKLSDYGESKIMNKKLIEKIDNEKSKPNGQLYTSYNGTIQYAPMEVLEGDILKIGTHSDIYSFGTVIWEVFSERIPFEELKIDGFQLSLRIITEKLKPNLDYLKNGVPIEIRQLIEKCWDYDIHKRPTITYILEELERIQKKYNFFDQFSELLLKIEKKAILDESDRILYVHPQGNLLENPKNTFDLLNYTTENFLKGDKKMMLLTGTSGSGKTFFADYLQDYILNYHRDILPFAVELSTITDPVKNLIPGILKYYKINDPKDIENIQKNKILFILDGFDEIYSKENIYITNKLNEFTDAKVIITCRDDYIKTKSIKQNFNKYFSTEKKDDLIRIFLDHFKEKEIKQYIKNFLTLKLKCEKYQYWTPEKYFKIFNKLSESLKMLNSPYLINIMCEIIPTNEIFRDEETMENIKRYSIYELFLNHIYLQELKEIQKSNQETIKFKSLLLSKKVKEIMDFSTDMACDLFLKNNSFSNQDGEYSSNYIFEDKFDENNVFNKYFKDDAKTDLFFKITPLINIEENRYIFSHKSIMEFFVATRIIKEIRRFNVKMFENSSVLKNLLSNQINISEHSSILSFVIDYIEINSNFEDNLWNIIYFTKESSDIDLIASNCMTILSKSGKEVKTRDLSDLRIPYADFEDHISDEIENNSNIDDDNDDYSEEAEVSTDDDLENFIFKDQITVITNLGEGFALGFNNGNILIMSREFLILKKLTNHESSIKSIACIFRQKYFVTHSLDGKINIYDLYDDFRCVKTFSDPSITCTSMAMSNTSDKNMMIIFGYNDGRVCIYEFGLELNQNFLYELKRETKNHNQAIVKILTDIENKAIVTVCNSLICYYDRIKISDQNYRPLIINDFINRNLTAVSINQTSSNEIGNILAASGSEISVYSIDRNLRKVNTIQTNDTSDIIQIISDSVFSEYKKTHLLTNSIDGKISIYSPLDNYKYETSFIENRTINDAFYLFPFMLANFKKSGKFIFYDISNLQNIKKITNKSELNKLMEDKINSEPNSPTNDESKQYDPRQNSQNKGFKEGIDSEENEDDISPEPDNQGFKEGIDSEENEDDILPEPDNQGFKEGIDSEEDEDDFPEPENQGFKEGIDSEEDEDDFPEPDQPELMDAYSVRNDNPYTFKALVGPIMNNNDAAGKAKNFLKNNDLDRDYRFEGNWRTPIEYSGTNSVCDFIRIDETLQKPTVSQIKSIQPLNFTYILGPINDQNQAYEEAAFWLRENKLSKRYLYTGKFESVKTYRGIEGLLYFKKK